MSDYLPHYDELYVVSDIHMGGAGDFQIFNKGDRLANLVGHIARQRPDGEVALVLNGDIIDSLAEDLAPDYVALDAEKARKMMERIYKDASFAMVWNAFADFVRTKGRTLILVVGNHDIELALPPVESSVRQRLADGDVAAKGRIIFATHGSGFACTVGPARVFCTHGNEVDGWNMVDYTKLGELANAMNAGRRPDSEKWEPNAGTRLVIDVMNAVKRKFPFVDLLKPETQPVLATLFTLDRSLTKRALPHLPGVVWKKIGGDRQVRDLLSAGGDLAQVSADRVADVMMTELLGPNLRARVESVCPKDEDSLLLNAERTFKGEGAKNPIEDDDVETLGVFDIVASRLGLIDEIEGLRRALDDWLKDDKTFDIRNENDSTFTDIVKRVGADVNYVVTGHTHLAREIEFKHKRHYYNCGTWIRLLRLTREVLGDEKRFKSDVYDVFEKKSMAALDKAMIPGPNKQDILLVFDRTNVVRILDDHGTTRGELLRATDGGQKGSVNLSLESQVNS